MQEPQPVEAIFNLPEVGKAARLAAELIEKVQAARLVEEALETLYWLKVMAWCVIGFLLFCLIIFVLFSHSNRK